MIRQGVATAANVAEAVRQLGQAISQPAVGFAAVFCSPRFDLTALGQDLAEAFAGLPLVGCTTAGEISPQGYGEHSLVGVSLSRDISFAVSQLIPHLAGFQAADGRALVTGLLQDLVRAGYSPSSHNTFAFLLIDGKSQAEEQVTSAISFGLGNIPLFGGSAGDLLDPRPALVLHDGAFHRNAAVLTLVHTTRPFKVFCTHHFAGGGPTTIVTGADPERRLITELNGESAAVEYARLFDRDVEELRTRSGRMALPPLMVHVGRDYYTRSVSGINPDNSLQMACAIGEGVPLSLGRNIGMLDNLRRVLDEVREAVGPPEVVIAMDCLWRRLETESLGAAAEVAGLFAENRMVGFSSVGEQIGAMHVNQTLTGVAIGRGDHSLAAAVSTSEESEGRQLERENAKLRKTVRVMLSRIESSMSAPGDTFTLFQNTVLLEDTVRKRTEELADLNRQLNRELMRSREIEAALLQAKGAADEANASKTQFMTAISHDLQQPLNAARLLLGGLLEEPLSPSGRAQVARIETALETAEEMLGDFLDVAKLDSGQVTHAAADFPVGPLLARLIAEYQPQARRRGLELRLVPSSAVIHTDRYLLQRILGNLLSNALRYTARGKVLLGCRRRRGCLVIEVWDTGTGIPADRIRDIFRPFYQLPDTPPTADRSSGLGLTIVERLCSVLDLSLDVVSDEGKGSGFRLALPLVTQQRQDKPSPAANPDTLLWGTRVLAVDGDAGALNDLAGLLRKFGCVVRLAPSLVEAKAALSVHPDLVVADFQTAGGWAGLNGLRAGKGHVAPILVVWSGTVADDVKDADRHGYTMLGKPVKPARLRSALTYLLCCRQPG